MACVMRFYTMAFVGMLFFESLLSGSLANRIGTPDPFFIDGTVCIMGSLLFFTRLLVIRKLVQPIYVKMSIVSELPPEL